MPQVTAKVKLVQYTKDPLETIASAAKICYATDTEKILEQNLDDAKSFVKRLISMGHMSPLEHISFTFYIEGVSRVFSHQLVRHRIGSYSQRSQRFVNEADYDYVMPSSFEGKTIETAIGNGISAVDYYKETMEIIAGRYKVLNKALGANGESSNEDARYVLPNACETKLFTTMNARALLNFFNERCCQKAQWEIRGVADEMLSLVKEVCPIIFDNAGPKCVTLGKCTEGKRSCGKIKEMKDKYNG